MAPLRELLDKGSAPGSQGGAVMTNQLDIGQVGDELTQALEELARLARDGVPGCDGASISVLHRGSVSTSAATQPRVVDIDRAQYRLGDGPCVTAIRNHQDIAVDDYESDGRWPGVAAEAVNLGIRSSLSLPMVDNRGTALGGLNMYGGSPSAFDEASQRSAAIFARHGTLILTQLRLLHNERAARAREHDVAATLQRSLLPSLPDLPGITSAARYLVSQEQAQVGGDWYDLFALPDGAIGIAIGDVMGHDLAAAAAMGQLRSVLRSYAYEGHSPSVVLDRLDRLVQGFEMAQAATAVFGRLLLDDAGATLLLANAGHLPPILRHPDGSVHQIQRASSPLIGVLRPGEQRRSEAALSISRGSLLLLYTDGLVETRQREYDTGIDELCAALTGLDSRTGPEEVCEELLRALVGGLQEDDIALLAVRIDELPI
jgi:serine phosphatase RsbU (regulator of sigma subunit)